MRKNVSSGSPFEKPIGFSRASRIGNHISVSGTAAIAPDGSTAHIGDVYQQTKHCLIITKSAIEEAGGKIEKRYQDKNYANRYFEVERSCKSTW